MINPRLIYLHAISLVPQCRMNLSPWSGRSRWISPVG